MRTFEAVWTTLGLDALGPQQRTLGVSDTIRRDTVLAMDVHGTAPTLAAPSSSESVEATIAAAGRGDVATLRRDIAVTGLLGEGGMGRVLLGYQRSLRREVALKTVHPNSTWEARSAVLSEGFITGHLEHPNIIPVHELGLDSGGMPLLVMKRVVGFEWSELLADPNHVAWKSIPAFAMRRPEDRLEAHIEILMQATLRSDMFIAALSAAVLGAHGTRAWFAPSGVMVLSAILSGLYPPQTHVIWAGCSMIFFFSIALVWRRAVAMPGPE